MNWNQELADKVIEQLGVFFQKYISFAALVALAVKFSVQIQKKTLTWLGFLTSIVIGLGSAYLCKGAIEYITQNEGFQTILTGLVAIAADKVAEYLIFKMKVDGFFKKIGDLIIDYLRKILGLKDE